MEDKSCHLSPTNEKGDDQNMTKNFVTIKGKEYYAEDGKLDLSGKGVTDIAEIIGLEHLSNLEILRLDGNQIKEIRGLEHLTNLEILRLDDNQIEEISGLEHLTNLEILDLRNNQIQEIKGLEHLSNLKVLYLRNNQIQEIKGLEHLSNLKFLILYGNPIRDDERHLVDWFAQKLVRYCQEKSEKGKIG